MSWGFDNTFNFDEIVSLCRKFDVNNDGKLSAEELMPALQSLGFNATKEDVKKIMDAADNNGDGMIEYESDEFVALLDELDDEPMDRVLEAFQFLDKNGDGQISAEELRLLVTTHGNPMSQVRLMMILLMMIIMMTRMMLTS